MHTRVTGEGKAVSFTFLALEAGTLCYWTLSPAYQVRMLPLTIAALVLLSFWSFFIARSRPTLSRLGLGGVVLMLVLLLCANRAPPTDVRKLMLERSTPGVAITNSQPAK